MDRERNTGKHSDQPLRKSNKPKKCSFRKGNHSKKLVKKVKTKEVCPQKRSHWEKKLIVELKGSDIVKALRWLIFLVILLWMILIRGCNEIAHQKFSLWTYIDTLIGYLNIPSDDLSQEKEPFTPVFGENESKGSAERDLPFHIYNVRHFINVTKKCKFEKFMNGFMTTYICETENHLNRFSLVLDRYQESSERRYFGSP